MMAVFLTPRGEVTITVRMPVFDALAQVPVTLGGTGAAHVASLCMVMGYMPSNGSFVGQEALAFLLQAELSPTVMLLMGSSSKPLVFVTAMVVPAGMELPFTSSTLK